MRKIGPADSSVTPVPRSRPRRLPACSPINSWKRWPAGRCKAFLGRKWMPCCASRLARYRARPRPACCRRLVPGATARPSPSSRRWRAIRTRPWPKRRCTPWARSAARTRWRRSKRRRCRTTCSDTAITPSCCVPNGWLTKGKRQDAAGVYRQLYGEVGDVVIKTAALRGILMVEKVQAADVALGALKDANAKLRMSAAKLVCEGCCPKLIGAVFAGLSSLPADAQAALLDLVNDPVALPTVIAAAKSGDEAVRAAALGALGRIGDAASVGLLLKWRPGARAGCRRQLGRVSSGCVAPTSTRPWLRWPSAMSRNGGWRPSAPWQLAAPCLRCPCC